MRRKPVRNGGMTSVERKTLNRLVSLSHGLISSYILIYRFKVITSFLFSFTLMTFSGTHLFRYLEWIRDTGSSQDTQKKI